MKFELLRTGISGYAAQRPSRGPADAPQHRTVFGPSMAFHSDRPAAAKPTTATALPALALLLVLGNPLLHPALAASAEEGSGGGGWDWG